MFDRVVLRRIRRVVRHPDLHPQGVDQPLKVGPEQVGLAILVIGGVAAAAVAEQQQRLRRRVGRATEPLPPVLQAVAGEFAGIMTGAEMDVPAVVLQVVDPVGQHHPLGELGEVVVEHPDRLARAERAVAEEIAEQFPRFQVHAEDRVGGIEVLALEPGDRLELGVAIGMAAQRLASSGPSVRGSRTGRAIDQRYEH